VRSDYQRRGIGGDLLQHFLSLSHASQVLVGTSEDATWAVRFFERHGFTLVSCKKDELLQECWDIPDRQNETSVVLRRRGDKSPFSSGNDAKAADASSSDVGC
jgi:ribosomal protein S18 acetylase RimI-like enzyme